MWEETPTHRIKIKREDGREVGRWEFPRTDKEKAPAPAASGKGASPGTSMERGLGGASAAREAARKAGLGLGLILAFGGPQQAVVESALASGELSKAASGRYHLMVASLAGLSRMPAVERDAALAFLRDYQVAPSPNVAVLLFEPQGSLLWCELPATQSWSASLAPAQLTRLLSSPYYRERLDKAMQQMVAARTLVGFDQAKALHEALLTLQTVAIQDPQLRRVVAQLVGLTEGRKDQGGDLMQAAENWSGIRSRWKPRLAGWDSLDRIWEVRKLQLAGDPAGALALAKTLLAGPVPRGGGRGHGARHDDDRGPGGRPPPSLDRGSRAGAGTSGRPLEVQGRAPGDHQGGRQWDQLRAERGRDDPLEDRPGGEQAGGEGR